MFTLGFLHGKFKDALTNMPCPLGIVSNKPSLPLGSLVQPHPRATCLLQFYCSLVKLFCVSAGSALIWAAEILLVLSSLLRIFESTEFGKDFSSLALCRLLLLSHNVLLSQIYTLRLLQDFVRASTCIESGPSNVKPERVSCRCSSCGIQQLCRFPPKHVT